MAPRDSLLLLLRRERLLVRFEEQRPLVGGVLLGAALGWVLDRWLGSSPWGLIVLVLLGFAGGVLNVMRAAGVVSSSGPKGPDR